MTDREKNAYAAGVIDGDGSIQIVKNRDSDSYHIRVTIVGTNKDLIDWFVLNYPQGKYYFQKRKRDQDKLPVHMWNIWKSEDAYNFIVDLFPFLRAKKKHAIVILNFWNRDTYDGSKYFEEIKLLQTRKKEVKI